MDIPSKYVVDRQVSLYLLLYVLLHHQMSDDQKSVIGSIDEMDAEMHNLAKLVLPGYASQWPKMVRLQIPHLKKVMQDRFPDLAQLSIGHLLEGQFRLWLANQVNRFGDERLKIDPQ